MENNLENVADNTEETQVVSDTEQQPEVSEESTPETQENTVSEFTLPDGRVVDGEGVLREYKYLLSDYTKKSTKLKEYEKNITAINSTQTPTYEKPWQDPNWVPQTYAELIEASVQAAKDAEAAKEAAYEEEERQINEYIDSQLSELKKVEPNLNEDLLFQHATKYGFQDLQAAYQNMKDFNVTISKVREQAVKEIQQRKTEPVAGIPSGTPTTSTGVDMGISQRFGSAIEYLQALRGNK